MWGLIGTPRPASHSSVSWCERSRGPPSFVPSWYAKKSRSRDAVTFGSFWRRLPAAALRGLANSRSPRVALSPVELLERRERHEDLAPHLEPRSGTSTAPVASRFGIDPMVAMFAVTSSPVTPSPRVRRDRQAPAFVEQRDGEAVELGLADERDRPGDDLRDPLVPGVELVAAERVVEREHRHDVLHRRERAPTARRPGAGSASRA